jgi:hypothetical protein
MDPSQLENIAAAENVGNAPGKKRFRATLAGDLAAANLF